jgi:beta-lactamase regulating signal transducer with metallopeptidase domain/5-hydroxyisourate hydrolase-like protein (transthyretin family)
MNPANGEEPAMNVRLITLLESMEARVVHAGWQAAVLGLCVLALSWVLGTRLPAHWRFALWLVVFARLALPVVPAAPWSIFRLVPALRERPATNQNSVLQSAEQTDRPTALPAFRPKATAAPAVAEAPLDPGAPPDVPVIAPSLSPAQWFAVIWPAGVLLVVLRRVWLGLRLARQRESWRPVMDPTICAIFAECRNQLRVARRVELLWVPGLSGPATCGVFHPRILLPETLGRLLSPGELRLVLLHELMHVRPWDVLSEQAAALLTAVHWFNPVAWLAIARLRRERELACDAAVLDHTGPYEAGPYGGALLKIVEFIQTPGLLSGAVGVSGRDLALTRRIQMIACYRKPSAASAMLGGVLVLVLAASGWTDAGRADQAREAVPADPGAGDQTAPGKTVTVAGVCRDETGKPLPGVRVVVYREDFDNELKTDRLRELATDTDGRFRFGGLASIPREGQRAQWYYALVVNGKGRASTIRRISAGEPFDKLTITMPPAATLEGRVTDPAGKPIAGAMVWRDGLLSGPLEGVLSARTDQDGRYAVTDLHAWDYTKQKPTPSADGRTSIMTGPCYFSVRHPDYGNQRPLYRRIPDTINVTLQPAGVLEGRVVDQLTGKPAAKVGVWLQGTNGSDPSADGGHTLTDQDGRYRLTSLAAAKYNAWAHAPDRASVALDSFAVVAGKTHQAPDLLLVEGGWIEGRLVDAETGKPISRDTQSGRLMIGLYGPSRPKSGAACQGCDVDDRGGFRLRVAPGLNFPYIMSDVWDRTQRREFYEKGVEVKSGEVVRLRFRILAKKPVWDPDPAPVRLAVPVPTERAAATAVRLLGGWYGVDKDNHVIEVNMVYHETPEKVRYDNGRNDTDEALRTVGAFPRLQKLFLYKGQATDEGLKSLASLKDLRILYIWDAEQIADAGTKNLANLIHLEELHISNGQIGDPSLEVFSRLPRLGRLSLQGNAISDEGLKHLAGMKQLRTLWVGMSRRPITDAGATFLAGLTGLEELDLQGSRLSDAGVAALKPLKQLRWLGIPRDPAAGAGGITDASVEPLLGLTKLQHLWIQNSRITGQGVKRLVELPALKELCVSPRSLPEDLRAELQKRRPGLQLHLSGSAEE